MLATWSADHERVRAYRYLMNTADIALEATDLERWVESSIGDILAHTSLHIAREDRSTHCDTYGAAKRASKTKRRSRHRRQLEWHGCLESCGIISTAEAT